MSRYSRTSSPCCTCSYVGGCCAGGELQRFAIAVVAAQQADVYMIDEPSSYLDVRQRLKAAQVLVPRVSIVIVAKMEHRRLLLRDVETLLACLLL